MSDILPYFKTQGSFYKSLLTVEKEDEIAPEYSVSIYSIVKNYKLEKITIIDTSMYSFPSIYKNLGKICDVVFGMEFLICKDAKDKSDNSLKTESKICILMRNSAGYKDLLGIHNIIFTNQDYFYYKTRLDWPTLLANWTDNLLLFVPPYKNFIHKNLLYDSICVPDFAKIRPILTYSKMELPFDYLLEENIKKYALNNKYDLLEVHPICYYKNDDIKTYINKRCVEERSSFSKPELENFSSDKLNWESYCEKAGLTFIK